LPLVIAEGIFSMFLGGTYMTKADSLFILIFSSFLMLNIQAKTITSDRALNKEYKRYCEEIKKYHVKSAYKVNCYSNYHHFNSDALKSYRTSASREIKIAGYNLLHPGNAKNSYKDYRLVAKVMNKFDLVAATELLPSLSRDRQNNADVIAFLRSNPSSSDAAIAKTLYREPGYIKVLEELRKIDSSWALLLTPRGDASKSSHVHELSGFYYRAKVVKPVTNYHCKGITESGSGTPYACYPNLRSSFMGRDTSKVFSRRPFLGRFQSRNFDFSLLTSHVIFTSPSDSTEMKNILKPSFGVSNYTDIGRGVYKVNYARIAETKIILEFMDKYRAAHKEDDIIYVGDMNLEKSNSYLDTLMKDFPGGELLISTPTTMAITRYDVDGRSTEGLASNFDHFIMDNKESKECLTSSGKSTAKVISYFEGDILDDIRTKYFVRSTSRFDKYAFDNELEDISTSGLVKKYRMTSSGKAKMEKLAKEYESTLRKRKTISRNRIVIDEESKIKERVGLFKKRLFEEQQYDRTFYRVYKEVLSDHLPIEITCRTSSSDDD
jgi:hypothetical protein